MFTKMPWDELRDGADNELAEELAALEVEASERAFAAALAAELPGLAKTRPSEPAKVATK